MRRHSWRVRNTDARPNLERRRPLFGGASPTTRSSRALSQAGPHWHGVVAAAGGCAAVVAGALLVANVHNGGQQITIRPAAQGGPVAGTMFVSSIGPMTSAGETTTPGFVTVYRPGAYGNVRPEAVIKKGLNSPLGITVDSSGDLWVANGSGNTVVDYSRTELVKASPNPTVTLSTDGNPTGVAFDPSGDLWVAVANTVRSSLGSMEEFTPAQLKKSGSPAPVFTLNEADCRFAFDSSGNLWEGSGDNSSSDSLSEWTKAQLARPGSAVAPAPKVLITSSALDSPCTPGFDRTGDLWVAMVSNKTVVEFTKAQLAKSGATAPKVVISSSVLGYPCDVTFDTSGNLWVPYQSSNDKVVEFTKSELAKSGAPAPARTISGHATGLFNPFAVAFEP